MKKVKCLNCAFYCFTPFLFVQLNITVIEESTIKNVQNAIFNADTKSNNEKQKCNCGQTIHTDIEFQKIIIFDVQKNPKINEYVELLKIPVTIELNNIKYHLKGIIEFSNFRNAGHYTACVKRPDNDLKRSVTADRK